MTNWHKKVEEKLVRVVFARVRWKNTFIKGKSKYGESLNTDWL